MNQPLVDKFYLLEKIPGKGGWTYACIPEISSPTKTPFGWVKVKGFIDDFEFKDYKLMPMGKGKLFLPVRAEIRKKIHKEAGNWVRIILFLDTDSLTIPDEFLSCLKDDPIAFENFIKYTESEKKVFIDWIYASKKDSTRVERIAKTINKIQKGLKFKD